MSDVQRSPIAVVGVSALFPGSIDKTGFWRDILAGRDLLADVPQGHWLVDDYYHPEPRTQEDARDDGVETQQVDSPVCPLFPVPSILPCARYTA